MGIGGPRWEGRECDKGFERLGGSSLLSNGTSFQNMEKIVIRPTAFKPVLPKPRGVPSLPSFLGPRATGPSGSQGSLTQLFGGPASSSSSSSSSAADKPLILSGWASGCPSGTLSDSGRNSLSSLPTYSTGGAEPATNSPGGHLPSHGPGRGALPGPARGAPTGPSHSDSGRSSSSKSTGSLGGRMAGGLLGSGPRASPDSSSCGERSPPPPPPPPPPSDEALLHCVLEGKLRDREAELQQLRDSLDESEVTMCQVWSVAVMGVAWQDIHRCWAYKTHFCLLRGRCWAGDPHPHPAVWLKL